MNTEIRTLLEILKGSLNQDHLELNEVDIEKFAKTAHLHRLSALCYHALLNQELSHKESLLECLRQDHFDEARRHVQQAQAQKELSLICDDLKMPYLFFKGLQFAQYYPHAYLRSMSDLDLLIKEEDRDKLNAYLIKDKYVLMSKQLNEWIYKKGPIVVEVHTQLLHPSDVNALVSDYFSKVLKQNLIDKGNYSLSNEHHFVYALCHLSKHLYGSGAGLRFMMDLVYMFKGMGLDEECLWGILNELHLSEFAKVVFSLMRRWFNSGPYVENISSHKVDLLEEMICGESVYGEVHKQEILIKARRIHTQAKHSKVWVMIFPQRLTLSEQIHRWGIWILHPFKTSKQYRLIKQKENQAKAWLEELKEIGLYD